MPKISDLQNRKNQLIADAQVLVNDGKAASVEYRTILADIDATQETLDLLSRTEKYFESQPKPAPVASPVVRTETREERKAKLSAAYRHYLLHGSKPDAAEQRSLLTSGDTIGGALIPQEFEGVIHDALKFYGPIATLVAQRNANSGRPQKFTISDDTAATMTYIAEDGTSAATQADPTLQSHVPATDALVTTVKYSLQMLEDADSFESFIRDVAGLRCSRAVEYALTLGKDNGTNTTLPNSPTGGLLGSVTTGATTSTLAAGIGYADLIALAGSVDHAYYVNGAYLASPSVHNYLLGQKDSTSRPYYNVDPSTGLLMVNGKPLYVNNAMPAYNAASSPVVLFGDFSRAYAYVNGGGMRIRVLHERYAVDSLQGAAVIYQRLGAAKLVSGAVKALVTAGS
jgi:HK97 family phage major capsid protein